MRMALVFQRLSSKNLRARAPFLRATLLAAVFLAYAVLVFDNVCFVAGGSDSAGYLASARLFASGKLALAVPELEELGLSDDYLRAFIPLGFVPGPEPHTMVASYPPGLPLQMAAASLLGGQSLGPYLVSPVLGLLCLVLLYATCRELGVTRSSAIVAPALLALCPVYVFYAVQPMSDVVACFWCLLAVFCCLRSERSLGFAAAAGAALGMAVLVRPTNLLLALPLLAYLAHRPKALLWFGVGGVPCAAFLLYYNQAAYGGAFVTGYGSIAKGMLSLDRFPPRARHHTEQLLLQLSPVVVSAALAAQCRPWFGLRKRLLLASWFSAFFLFYCCYEPYETWWYLRFLLPALPAVVLAAVGLWDEFASVIRNHAPRLLLPLGGALLAGVVALQGLQLARYQLTQQAAGQAREYVATSRLAARLFPQGAYTISMQTSGSLKYYLKGSHIVRWDWLDDAQAKTLAARAAGAGMPLYALLFPFEVAAVQQRFRGAWQQLGAVDAITLWRVDVDSPPAR